MIDLYTLALAKKYARKLVNESSTPSSLEFKGSYDQNTFYQKNSLISFGSNLYIAVQDVPIGTPLSDEDYWKIVLQNAVSDTVVFEQSTPEEEWNIQHNMQKFPNVTIVDNSNKKVLSDVEYVDKNNIKISFAAPFSGKALLN